MIRRLILALLCALVTAGAGMAESTSRLGTGRERPDDPPRLLMSDNVFIGTIDSVFEFDYVPSGTCAAGVTPGREGGAIIRVTEILHGEIVSRSTFVAGVLHRLLDPPGTRVLVLANRTCAFDDRLWGLLLRVTPDARLAGVRSTLQMAGYPKDYWFPRPQAPRLDEVRTADVRYRGKTSPPPLEPAATLDLVQVETIATVGADRVVLRLRPLVRLAGVATLSDRPVRILCPNDGGGNILPAVGDSLLLPSTDGEPRLGFAARPGDFLVDRGFSSRLDVALEDVGDRIRRVGDGYVIVASGRLPAD